MFCELLGSCVAYKWIKIIKQLSKANYQKRTSLTFLTQVTYRPSANLRYESTPRRLRRSSPSHCPCFATQRIMDTHRLELSSKIFTIFIITIPLVQSTWQSWLLFASLSRRSPPSLGTHCHHYITGKNHTLHRQKFNNIVSFKLKFKLLPPVSASLAARHSVSASAHVPKAAQVVTKTCSGMRPKFWIWERGSFQSGGCSILTFSERPKMGTEVNN